MHMMKSILMLLLILAPVFQAQAVGGKVTHLKGILEFPGKRTFVPLKEGTKIPEGETLHLVKGKMATIELDDGTNLKMKMGTRIVFSKEKTPTIELKEGTLFTKMKPARTESLDKSKLQTMKFTIKTRSAILDVHGTEFFASIEKKDGLWICVRDGRVEVAKIEAEEKTTTVNAGEGILVEASKPIEKPHACKWPKN